MTSYSSVLGQAKQSNRQLKKLERSIRQILRQAGNHRSVREDPAVPQICQLGAGHG